MGRTHELLFNVTRNSPRKPTRGDEEIACPHCQRRFTASMRAITLRCPSCTGRIDVGDMIVDNLGGGSLATTGSVSVGPRGQWNGPAVCSSLKVEGKLTGNVRVHGAAIVTEHAILKGNVDATSLLVRAGAVVEGRVNVKPQERVES